jgi:RNA polymerase sigma factor (sigma-70 family)
MIYPDSSNSRSTRASLLLRLNASGNSQEIAWQEFYDQYGPIIGGFCRRMGASSEDVLDIVQQVMLGFFSISPTFHYDPHKGRFRAYLKTCTCRALQRHVKARKRIRPLGAEIDAADPAVDAVWEDLWERERLHAALELVRRRYTAREDTARTFRAFEMCTLLELPVETVARELQMNPDSVYQAKTRVRKALKAALKASADDEE